MGCSFSVSQSQCLTPRRASFYLLATCPLRLLCLAGAAGSYAVTTGGCTLTRKAAPLQLDYVLDCTEPGVTVTTSAPRYTSRYVSAAAASTEVGLTLTYCMVNSRLLWACHNVDQPETWFHC